MSWQQPGQRVHRTLLEPPADGVALSTHPMGWLGRRLRAIIEGGPRTTSDRVQRGKNYAKRGRARDLMIMPGTARAEVYCDEVYQPVVHCTSLTEAGWSVVIEALAADLSALGALMACDLPESFVDALKRKGVSLVPSLADFKGDCDCGDWEFPCTHVASVLHLLTDALDGDPYLLLTLRGVEADALMATLRARWGDTSPLDGAVYAGEEPVPSCDPFRSPTELPELHGSTPDEVPEAAGLRALGPAPDGVDLLSTLAPLYAAGSQAAFDTLDAVPDREPPRRRLRGSGARPPAVPRPQPSVKTVEPPPSSSSESTAVTSSIVSALARQNGQTSGELATSLAWTVSRVRTDLLKLLELGQIRRTVEEHVIGNTVRWWLN